ncbi:hypothetical protein AAFC00_007086 [Neodothiora populina]|uniref:Replication protein A C-terminal domain-containing protein n=1 Tax=Neodothiora populina TaxID=2781224 RepID=A0ABR3PCQ6_9PEZI
MDYGYTTSYSAQGGAGGGGFMPGSQADSPSGKKQYGKDTLRPVTIKQLIDAQHPNPDAEFFEIDGTEASQITFVGQIRNISKQVTNITYRLDDGTGTFEVKMWIDTDSANDENDVPAQKGLVENAYARVFGKLKTFGKRHVVAHAIKPVTDMNEINYHLLEATYVHLYFQRGPLGQKAEGGANGQQDGGYAATGGASTGGGKLPASASSGARRVYECIANTPQTNEGLHMQDIAGRTGMDTNDVLKAGDELQGIGVIYTTVDDHTWALLDV